MLVAHAFSTAASYVEGANLARVTPGLPPQVANRGYEANTEVQLSYVNLREWPSPDWLGQIPIWGPYDNCPLTLLGLIWSIIVVWTGGISGFGSQGDSFQALRKRLLLGAKQTRTAPPRNGALEPRETGRPDRFPLPTVK